MDLAKYRTLFLEEASEHLSEMSRALLDLEKDPASGEAIDVVFRMAHSIKGMAGSLGYDALTELAHRLEDRMSLYRRAGRVEPGEGIGILFRGLEGLERMVETVRESGEPPPPEPELVALLGGAEGAAPGSEDGSAAGSEAPPAASGSGTGSGTGGGAAGSRPPPATSAAPPAAPSQGGAGSQKKAQAPPSPPRRPTPPGRGLRGPHRPSASAPRPSTAS